jgi:hypothetical protein
VVEEAFATLVRFYGIDPARLLELPTGLVNVLFRQMPTLQQQEWSMQRIAAAEGASYPYLKRDQQSRAWGRIRRGLEARRPKPPPVRVIEYDPEKAREWFEQQGLRVSDGREL